MHKRQNAKRMTATVPPETLRLADASPEQTAREAKQCFVPKTQFGRRLWTIRKRIIATGQPLLGWEQIEQDLLERRGEHGGEV